MEVGRVIVVELCGGEDERWRPQVAYVHDHGRALASSVHIVLIDTDISVCIELKAFLQVEV